MTHSTTASLVDPSLPQVGALLVRGLPDPLRVAMAASGVRLTEAAAVQVTWWPGKSITVRFRAQLEGGGLEGTHQLVAVAGDIPDGLAVVEGEKGRVGVWRVPYDPFLPGLKHALSPVAAARLLTDLGFPTGPCQPRLVAYRPGNRAVVAVRGESGSVFLKVVAPSRVVRLHDAHRLIASRTPIPASLGMDPDLGIVVLQALPGITLRQTLIDGQPVPDPWEVMSLAASLPDPKPGSTTQSPIQRLHPIAGMLSTLLPDRAGLLESLAAEIGKETDPRLVPVHGDFYETQVMVQSGALAGMLDVDTFGWGRPGDDAATFLGHLSVLDLAAPNPRVRAWASRLLKVCDMTSDPVGLRRRVAAVIVTLAPGPFRVQAPDWPVMTRSRLDLAARWCQSAARLAVSSENTDLVLSEPSGIRAAN